jgi:saccharopine dehydrogenase-like NADP-dependent oxidoreductase
VTVLKELGLLSEEPVVVDGAEVAPKRVVDAVLYPRTKLDERERDITLFRVEAMGSKGGDAVRLKVEMVDRYDDKLGFASMARTTAFTGAIVARFIAKGEIAVKGLLTPEQVIVGPILDRLLEELAEVGVRFEETMETL